MKNEKIIAIKKDNLDRIVEFKTNENNIYNYEMAKEAIINGQITNAIVKKDKNDLFLIKEKTAQGYQNFEKMEEF